LLHVNAVALYIIMGVYTLLKEAVLPKVGRKFQIPSSRSEGVGYKSITGMLAGLSSHCHAESGDIKLE
jgi:hypothetical protein